MRLLVFSPVHVLLLLQILDLAAQAQVRTLLSLENGLRNPYGVCAGRDRALYICDIDNHVIHRLVTGKAEKFIGSGVKGYAGDGGAPRPAPARSATPAEGRRRDPGHGSPAPASG